MPRKYSPPTAMAARPIGRLGSTAPIEKRQAIQPEAARINSCDASRRLYGIAPLCHASNGGSTAEWTTKASGCATTRHRKSAKSTHRPTA